MAGGNDTNGLTTALALAGGVGDLGREVEAQDDMFEADAPMTLPPIPRAASGPRGGRPAGARNKSTEQWRAYLLGRYRSPLVECLEILARTPEELARTWKLYKWHEGKPVFDTAGNHVLDTGAAVTLQMQARTAALPYLHQRQPMAVEVEQKQLGRLVISLGGDDGEAAGDELALPGLRIEQNQQVIDVRAEQSDDASVGRQVNPLNGHDNS